jgi:hypothetical protein
MFANVSEDLAASIIRAMSEGFESPNVAMSSHLPDDGSSKVH